MSSGDVLQWAVLFVTTVGTTVIIGESLHRRRRTREDQRRERIEAVVLELKLSKVVAVSYSDTMLELDRNDGRPIYHSLRQPDIQVNLRSLTMASDVLGAISDDLASPARRLIQACEVLKNPACTQWYLNVSPAVDSTQSVAEDYVSWLRVHASGAEPPAMDLSPLDAVNRFGQILDSLSGEFSYYRRLQIDQAVMAVFGIRVVD